MRISLIRVTRPTGIIRKCSPLRGWRNSMIDFFPKNAFCYAAVTKLNHRNVNLNNGSKNQFMGVTI
jgi:hypothetical protein